jgi:hypothetical protein
METKNQSSTKKNSKSKIQLAIIVGCCVAIAIGWYKHEVKVAVDKAIAENNSNKFAYTLADVERVLEDQLQGWNNGNIDQFMEGYIKDSSVRFITNKKVKTSWQEITDSYKKGYPNKDAMGKLTFHRDEIRWINEAVGISQVIGRWEVLQKHQDEAVQVSMGSKKLPQPQRRADKPVSNDTLSGRFSLIFIGTEKGPRIQVDHTW